MQIVLLIFGIRLKTSPAPRIEPPELVFRYAGISDDDECSGRNGTDFLVRRKVGIWLKGEIACDIVGTDLEYASALRQPGKVAAPQKRLAFQGIKELFYADVVSGEDDGALSWVVNRDRPVADEPSEGGGSVRIEHAGDDRSITAVAVDGKAQGANQVLAVVQSTVPHQNRSACEDERLIFATGVRSRVERTIEHAQGVIEVGMFAFRAEFGEIKTSSPQPVRTSRCSIEIENPRLHAHSSPLSSSNAPKRRICAALHVAH